MKTDDIPTTVLDPRDDRFVQLRVAIELQKVGALGKPNADLALLKSEPGRGPEHDELLSLVHVTYDPDPNYPKRGNPPWWIWVEDNETNATLTTSRRESFGGGLAVAMDYLTEVVEAEWGELFLMEHHAVDALPDGPYKHNLSME